MNEKEVMQHYYAQSAKTLEQVYKKPERASDLLELQQKVREVLGGQRVLELACGTAYWTEHYASQARSVFATDVNQVMLDIAQMKTWPENKVQFGLADAFNLPSCISGEYSACFAGFFWSHVRREEQVDLLKSICLGAGRGSQLLLIDNNYVEGSSTPIARTDAEGNTFQIRLQEDGTRVEIVKNFPSDSALRKKFGPLVRDIRIFRNTHFWMLSCILK